MREDWWPRGAGAGTRTWGGIRPGGLGLMESSELKRRCPREEMTGEDYLPKIEDSVRRKTPPAGAAK